MKLLLVTLTCIVLSYLVVSCSLATQNKAKASQLLNEINEIAKRSRENLVAQDIMSKSKRFSENRKNFPDSREELKTEAKFLSDFFAASIEEDKQIIQRYEELLKLGLVKPEADCVQNELQSSNLLIEIKKSSMSEFDLFSDETIKDVTTLETKAGVIREKTKDIDKNIDELRSWSDAHCRSPNNDANY